MGQQHSRGGGRGGKGRGRGPQRPPPPAAVPIVRLREHAGNLVLLGLIAAEAEEQVEQASDRIHRTVSREMEEARDADNAPLVDWWQKRRDLWRPLACEVSLEPARHPVMCAPSVVVRETFYEGREGKSLRFYLCRTAVVNVEFINWGSDRQPPLLLSEPRSVSDAATYAKDIVRKAVTAIGRFTDPTREDDVRAPG